MRADMFHEGPGGLPFAEIVNEFGKATLCLQGAHLTEWHPHSQSLPVTFLSAAVQYAPGKAIRGGIPICWPWFGAHPSDNAAPSHGIARTAIWQTHELRPLATGATQLTLRLIDSDSTRAVWPHPFALEYCITVGDSLELELVTTNTGAAPFTISEALHTYFRVADIGAAQVFGLDGSAYADVADAGRRQRQNGPIVFDGEVDRVFLDTEATCAIQDTVLSRRIVINKRGSRSTVVWNPGARKAAKLSDLTAAAVTTGGWRQLVCVETANALDNARTVEPGQSHRLSVRIHAEPSPG